MVVGGGDTAMEEATFLTRFAESGTVVRRRSTLRTSPVMQNRPFSDDKIAFAFDSEVAALHEKNGSPVGTGLFIAIGHDPRTELLAGYLRLDSGGYLSREAGASIVIDVETLSTDRRPYEGPCGPGMRGTQKPHGAADASPTDQARQTRRDAAQSRAVRNPDRAASTDGARR